MGGRPSFRPAFGRKAKPIFKPNRQASKEERAGWYPENWPQLSEEVRREANYRCQSHKLFGGRPCGVYAPPPFTSLLHVHHIVPLPKGSNKKSNLICLCNSCHAKAHNFKKGMGPTDKQKSLLKRLGKK